ncbi:Holliday junction resolvase RuvX [Acidocella aminolytica]|jgi:putative Holliday junction resolvase|uniref:Putative pre-16S rRNA nuclease n=1 Tax=Acidocella aminolytica 101 = DSM 11237 TaxID=1120923 RepID=A0A0D6PKQ0_9PROT|nr:Holliday junction resolvase RuvX [Acidocella aminolytica]GAN81778.1 Holliday junction resolvase [Acidocella aminolytica 101 = DSM 11237]GBQ37705.1 Holliday junction resolvase YqgF [Acidocella aminolytica 101 = DSM 11237]SHE52100.1 putative holliday junction resolvase [Acidocella aminolytica 101 = DSM 11237]
MALYNLLEFLPLLAPGTRLLGVDPGSKRIGVALSDVNRSVASPYTTLARAKMKQNAAELAAIIKREGVGGLIVGLPLDDRQKLGPRAQATRDWAHGISDATGLPVAMVDESYSTAETHERLISAGVSRARRAEIVDKLAAAEILQRALDKLAG